VARNAAFEILYREYYVRVFGLCRRLLNSSELAEDAAQEAFMRAYRNFRKYDNRQPFWRWIATIANNHCIDLLRQQSRTEALFGEESAEIEQIEAADAPPLGELISQEEAESLNAAVDNLAARYRVPLVLAYFSQLSYDEIAEQLDISRNHVGVLLLRAKQRLRTALVRDTSGDEP
jgi:RNA polymerase sigma-70 factor (ECF subfamily)